MPLDPVVDKYRVNPATGIAEPVESKPIVTFVALGRPTIKLQAGIYYYEDGTIVPKEELDRCGLSSDFSNGIRNMDVHPSVQKVIDATKAESIEAAAQRLMGGAR